MNGGSPFRSLVEAATRAPSGDNTQPWRFALDESAGRIGIHLDETRDPSPMNAGQRMARIALGAALENLLREAEHRGWAFTLERAVPPALAAVRVKVREGAAPGDAAIPARVTNRRPYDGRPAPEAVLSKLSSLTAPLDGVTTHWITGPERLAAFAPLIGRADATLFAVPAMLAAFLRKVRFDVPPDAHVDDGLSTASLEFSAANRILLRALPWLPHGLLKAMGAFRQMRARSINLVAGSSGLCLLAAQDGEAATDLTVGRAMQRAWLALTEQGLAVQPMMSLPVLENVLDHGLDLPGLSRKMLVELRDAFRAAAPEIAGRRPAYLMRFGFAPPPSARVGRLPVEAVIEKGEHGR